MDTLDKVFLFQFIQITPDRFGRHIEAGCQFGDIGIAAGSQEIEDLLFSVIFHLRFLLLSYLRTRSGPSGNPSW